MISTSTIISMRTATTLHGHPHGHAPAHTGTPTRTRHWHGSTAAGSAGSRFYDWLRPFAVGLVHGLAGSTAVALMILSVITEPVAALRYLLLFGLGDYRRNDADHADPVGAVQVHGC